VRALTSELQSQLRQAADLCFVLFRRAVEDLLKSYNQMTVLFTSVAEYVSTRLESLKVRQRCLCLDLHI
jgi:hypothetical protein